MMKRTFNFSLADSFQLIKNFCHPCSSAKIDWKTFFFSPNDRLDIFIWTFLIFFTFWQKSFKVVISLGKVCISSLSAKLFVRLWASSFRRILFTVWIHRQALEDCEEWKGLPAAFFCFAVLLLFCPSPRAFLSSRTMSPAAIVSSKLGKPIHQVAWVQIPLRFRDTKRIASRLHTVNKCLL